MTGVCLSVFVQHSASGQKSWEEPEDRKTNPSRPLQYSSSSISASPFLSLFHPIDPISWQSDLHLMQQQRCAVVFVSACVSCVYMWSLSLPSCKLHFSFQIQQTYPSSKTPCLPLFIHLSPPPYPTLFSVSTPPPSISLSTCLSIYPVPSYALSLSSVQSRQTHHYPSMRVLIHCPSAYVLF